MDVKNYNGWRFCPRCKNLLKPYHDGDVTEILQFKCRNQDCGDNGIIEVKIDKTQNKNALLLKKDYQAAKAIDITDNTLILDPSMPRKRVICNKCNYDEAIYFLKTDKNEKEIIIQYICANKTPICGNKWTQKEMNEPKLTLQ
ncbi:unnamed protein product [Paramecium primaurelia]|uniref:TFIIS-type domain-containing protein n=1 Tax=Paramecium primaurelia TaxID=5886 RepID=A0A8S1N9B0_PARPR|nr:unnamed protein product [Paramecium primaurelia]